MIGGSALLETGTTFALVLYFVALDLLVGGMVVAVNAWLRATPPHRDLLVRLVRMLPPSVVATALLGAAVLLLLRVQFGDGGAGSTLPAGLSDPTAWPRILHVLLAAAAVTGLFIAQAGLSLRAVEPVLGSWLARHGAAWTVFATLVNLLVGGWWFVKLPYESLIRFTGASFADMVAFSVAVVSALLSLGFVAMSATVRDPRGYLHAATAGFAVTLAAMVRMRETLRPVPLRAPEVSWTWLVAAFVLAAAGVLVLARAWRTFVGIDGRRARGSMVKELP